jgi:uncharacterized protein YfdQ (DUF2303 family)
MDAQAITTLVDSVKSEPHFLELGAEHRVAVLPDGWHVEDISKLLPPPDRIKQRVELLTLDSLVAYVQGFRGAETVIFANEGDATYDVAFDYHRLSRGTCDHIAKYACPVSDQWKTWTLPSNNGKAMSQVDFARFIENNLIDIVRPVSADMLQIVLNLQIHKSAAFRSDLRLSDGQTKLSYEEDIQGRSKVGDLTIPDTFQLGIPVFIDGRYYALEARLRYRLDDGKLLMWYGLVRPLDVYRAAVKEVSDSIRKQLTDVPFWIGKRA